jgi:3-hydroxymyristoyl/3-hydroxydecanoyl-(acyl carrier protein) dehydratase
MPGVLIIEAMAQVGGVLARLSIPGALDQGKEDSIFFMSMDKVKFRRPVVPSDQIVFELEPLRKGSRIWKMRGKATVDGKIVAEAELVASIG